MATTTWTLDPTHSELQFKVKHLMITTVTGSLNVLTASLTSESDDFENAQVKFEADTASIDTGNNDRDNHLKSGDFFNADEFPKVSFVSTSFTKDGGDYTLKGDLTIKDVTKPVKLAVEFGGIATDPWGNTKAGFTISGKINRTDFGLNWNAALETGGVMVSEEVKILGELQFVKQA
ncbi:YceI family protein [Pedobacter heparinus]|uniref:YceI family protein n=1 Tax=Pedobacter heparinus (strain ATCC 13125 / DSM 2366 / CIP 104194 / JCM 7457 / NBRC 12017 / NCIMB 9290 / NRRL B-14731 / HIM 762-3) TaxID=485917 RepID=C6XWG0_PEDHD|nr:YceI family protein [Pedobacter heparinus]ACU06249.1 YceI family protein [Pedobacter heparinus DSM 2366]